MKNIKFLAMAAFVAFGMSACDKGPDNNNGPIGADGDAAGLKLSISLPATGANTRAGDYAEIPAIANEVELKSVDVYVFDEDGVTPETPSDVTLTPTGTTYGHRHYAASDFNAGTASSVNHKRWDLKDGMQMSTIAGEDMRVWVGLNLPATVSAKVFDNETELLEEIATIASMIGTTDGFTMFSNVVETDLLPTTTNPDGSFINQLDADPVTTPTDPDDPTSYDPISVNRVTSKIIATSPTTFSPIQWSTTEVDANAPQLTYVPVGWYVMQYSTASYVAPHYNVKAWNSGPQAGSAETNKDDLFPYASVTSVNDMLTLVTPAERTDANLGTSDFVGQKKGRYIGENASTLVSGAPMALNGNTTYAFISTGVTATTEAVWKAATQTDPAGIYWDVVTGGYGNSVAALKDIFVVNVRGKEYITSTEVKAKAIQSGLAQQEAAAFNIVLTTTANDGDDSNGIEMTIENFFANPLYEQFDYVDIFTYEDGYVHFMQWINKEGANDYNVLRNQLIDMNVTGLNADLNDGFDFPGYPGDPTDPKKPIDPTDIGNPNNPDPKDPDVPVDPTAASLMVDISINPWTYRINSFELGR
ncbi:MAG: Mfa1 family fimbria major subunit [Alistipes sp.]|jgi:hypothetical protein|nr:Mfa1 family fimbria major subunit [Alistipes sp.]